jgi:hypothetical protein
LGQALLLDNKPGQAKTHLARARALFLRDGDDVSRLWVESLIDRAE